MTRRWLLLAGLSLGSCANHVQTPTEALTLSSKAIANHQFELRRFDTSDEKLLLAGSVGTLQDLGFDIDETNVNTGLVVGSKRRDAMESGQVATQIFLVALLAAGHVHYDPAWDTVQKIRASIVTKRSADGESIVAQVTFQRVIWNNKNQVSSLETVDEPTIHQQFFDKLSQAIFLEAHQI